MKLHRIALSVFLVIASAVHAAERSRHVVFIAGPPSHGPLEHEHRAGSLLLQKCLAGVPGVTTQVIDGGWPTKLVDGKKVDDATLLEKADAIIVYSDGGGGHPLLQGERLSLLDRLTKRGTGLGLLHYAVEPTLQRGQKEFLEWIGGAFEVHWSVNPHWEATFEKLPDHPVSRGVKPFSAKDEWYFNMRFRDGMRGVTRVLTAVPPPSTMTRPDGPHEGNPAVRDAVAERVPQTVMWLAERAEGGRGFGFTGGHFHRGWQNDDQRKVVLNAILWIAKAEIPEGGVDSKVTEADLMANLDPK